MIPRRTRERRAANAGRPCWKGLAEGVGPGSGRVKRQHEPGRRPGPPVAASGRSDAWGAGGVDPRLGQSPDPQSRSPPHCSWGVLSGSALGARGRRGGAPPPDGLGPGGRHAIRRPRGRRWPWTATCSRGRVGVDGTWDRWLAGRGRGAQPGQRGVHPSGLGDPGPGRHGEYPDEPPSLPALCRDGPPGRVGPGRLRVGGRDADPGRCQTPVETDTTLVMGSIGGRGILLTAAESGGVELATRTDIQLTRTSSDAVTGESGGNGTLTASEADAHRAAADPGRLAGVHLGRRPAFDPDPGTGVAA